MIIICRDELGKTPHKCCLMSRNQQHSLMVSCSQKISLALVFLYLSSIFLITKLHRYPKKSHAPKLVLQSSGKFRLRLIPKFLQFFDAAALMPRFQHNVINPGNKSPPNIYSPENQHNKSQQKKWLEDNPFLLTWFLFGGGTFANFFPGG